MSDHFTAFGQALAAEGKSDRTIRHYLSDLEQFATWFEQTNGETFAPQRSRRWMWWGIALI